MQQDLLAGQQWWECFATTHSMTCVAPGAPSALQSWHFESSSESMHKRAASYDQAALFSRVSEGCVTLCVLHCLYCLLARAARPQDIYWCQK